MTNPSLISVLMPAFNAEKTISAAVWSILNQSWEHFEFLIYLDGCTDRTADVLQSIDDPRIRVISAAENKGIVHARNELIKAAKGKYIAWLDADDIALPGRLAFQADYLDVHPDITFLGTWVETRNNRNVKTVKWPIGVNWVAAWSFYRNPLVQSSLMIRNKAALLQYDGAFEYLEDYDLLTRCLPQNNACIYPKVLCSYYEDDESQRVKKYLNYDFVGKLEKIILRNFSNLGLEPGRNELSLIREFLRSNKKIKPEEGKLIMKFILNAISANQKTGYYSKPEFNAVNAWQLIRLAAVSKNMILPVFSYFLIRPIMVFRAFSARVHYSS